MENIDIERLRKDLEDYFLGIMFNVSKAAMIDLTNVQNASDEELISIAIANGVDIDDYKIKSY